MTQEVFSIEALLAQAFLAQPSGAIVPAGTFDDIFAAEFAGDTPERIAKRASAQRVREGKARVPKTLDQRRADARAREAKRREKDRGTRLQNIAVIDFETDPFDSQTRDRIYPFSCCIYSDQFEPIVIWEEQEEAFVDAVLSEIKALPGAFTLYAHNGGKFDFMFLIHRLRGSVSFKGRGIMSAKIGPHELRDSLHIIPEKLAAYRKDEFDYAKLYKKNRRAHKDEIIKYMVNDCVYLFDIVKTFLTEYGFKISIGSAAMALLRTHYPQCENLKAFQDEQMRAFFFGGRVECIAGRGDWRGAFKLYDVNSMYPNVMANRLHPVGARYMPRKGDCISEQTCFVDLTCFSAGAFPIKRDGLGTIFPHEYGRYKVSIHEYNVALKYGLISRVRVNSVVDNELMTTFDQFILPLYQGRQKTKARLGELRAAGQEETEEYLDTKKDDIFLKLLQNNAYGKFAENPRKFKEHWITDPDARPDFEAETWGDYPEEMNADYCIWSRPTPHQHFRNVGTAASITGAARADLLEALQHSKGAVYCDTDSIICEELSGVPIHPTELGAWDLEAEINHIIVAGKKLYGYRKTNGKTVIKNKGASGLTWDGMKIIEQGGEILLKAFAPTLTKSGTQLYIDRTIRATTARKA